jgi:hypothetical protein
MKGLVVLLAVIAASPSVAQPRDDGGCSPRGGLARLAEVGEASGLAMSRVAPDRLWSINDSGAPVLFALNLRGAVTARVRLDGAVVEDWEAIATGPCPAGACLYIGDIGDNRAARKRITVYRVPEPAGGASAAVTDVFHGAYPDGPHDAETLLVTADGTMLIVTKGESGPIALYRFPPNARPGAIATLERVAAPGARKPPPTAHVTDGAISRDGEWTVLRTGSELAFHRTADLLAGRWQAIKRVSLASLHEPQGEGVAFGPGNVVFVAGEGGGRGMAGTFAQFACAPAR